MVETAQEKQMPLSNDVAQRLAGIFELRILTRMPICSPNRYDVQSATTALLDAGFETNETIMKQMDAPAYACRYDSQ